MQQVYVPQLHGLDLWIAAPVFFLLWLPYLINGSARGKLLHFHLHCTKSSEYSGTNGH